MPFQPAGDLAAALVSYSAGYTERFQLRRRIIPCVGAGNDSNVRIISLATHKKNPKLVSTGLIAVQPRKSKWLPRVTIKSGSDRRMLAWETAGMPFKCVPGYIPSDDSVAVCARKYLRTTPCTGSAAEEGRLLPFVYSLFIYFSNHSKTYSSHLTRF